MHTLQQMLEESNVETRSYSGRGMFGKTCLGVDFDDLGSLIVNVLKASQTQVAGENFDEVCEAFRGMRTDTMGKGRQIAYFPSVPYESEDEGVAADRPAEEDDEDGCDA